MTGEGRDEASNPPADAKVNATDMLIARNNPTSFIEALKLITVPVNWVPIAPPDEAWAPAVDMAWLGQYEQPSTGDASTDAAEANRHNDGLLANAWM